MATATKKVKTVEALSTRTLAWWAFKRLFPGASAFAFCVYAVPAIVAASTGGAS